MRFYKDKGLIYSEYILNMVSYYMADYEDISAKVETFYNCREQGYVLRVHDKMYTQGLCIWICAQRNSDEPTIVYDYLALPKEIANSFGESAYEHRYLVFEDVDRATKKVIEIIKDYFELEG